MRTFRIAVAVLCSVCLFLLTACNGYNTIMREHLSDSNNYEYHIAKICDIYYFDDDNQKVRDFYSDGFSEQSVVFELVFDDYDVVKTFLGAEPNPDVPLNEFKFQFRVTSENSKILMRNGFYDIVKTDKKMLIKASSFIYMDNNYFYIAEVVYGGEEYLPFEDGLENIIKFVNSHKSLI